MWKVKRFFKFCHVIFSQDAIPFPDQVAIFVIKFVEKLLNENNWYQKSCHIFNTSGKKQLFWDLCSTDPSQLPYLNEETPTPPFSFFLSPSPPLKSALQEIHFIIITSTVNYFQRSTQAEIRTLISLTNTSKCLYFIPSLHLWCFLFISRTFSNSF